MQFAGSIFCQYVQPGLEEVLIPLLFFASFVAFIWGVFYYAIAGEYDEHSREMSKGLMLWSILAFLFMAAIWGIIGAVYDAMGINPLICG